MQKYSPPDAFKQVWPVRFIAVTAAKVASKGVFKTAAKALSKMAASKAVAVLGGAAVGAAIGSVLPGVGTAVVGALGGVIGGLAIDGALLRLEEVISRAEFSECESSLNSEWHSPKSVNKYDVKTEMEKSKHTSKNFVCYF